MRILLDTCVVSEFNKPKPSKKVVQALENIATDDVFLSAVTIGEITKGISLLKSGRRRTELQNWLQIIENMYSHRLLPVDIEVARTWGEISAKAQQRGRVLSVMDGLIAAVGINHGLHVMTRNVSDFEVTGVLLINPWDD